MDLKTALGLRPGELVTLVGAGGKTTTAWRLLCQLAASGEHAVFATTTHIFEPQEIPLLLAPHPDPGEIARRLAESPTLALAAARGESGDPAHAARSPYAASPVKLVGLEPEVLNDLACQLPEVTWLVEADGARGRLLKAPAEYEPVIPGDTDRVIVVAGLDSIGKPLDEGVAHRPEIAARLLGVPLGTAITPDLFASLVGHASGGLRGIPSQSEVVVLFTLWADRSHIHAEPIARQLLSGRRVGRVVLVNLSIPHPVLKMWPEYEQSPTR